MMHDMVLWLVPGEIATIGSDSLMMAVEVSHGYVPSDK